MEKKSLILIVDDEPDILEILEVLFSDEYDVIKATNGEEAIHTARQKSPDLIVMDYKMPKKDGVAACKTIKDDILLRHTPVIMLTGKKETNDKVRGLNAGADDYMIKPFNAQELLARVKSSLKRKVRDLDANPLTRLPGNVSIYSELQKRIYAGEEFAVCYIDLDKFKAYNDKYGFERGDRVIKETAWSIIYAVGKSGDPSDFIGHIGGDDFVVVTENSTAEKLCKTLIEDFDRKVPSFYGDEDKEAGFIISQDRQGNTQRFAFLSMSIGIVTTETRKISHVGEVAQIGAELKKFAKNVEGSNYVLDQRKE